MADEETTPEEVVVPPVEDAGNEDPKGEEDVGDTGSGEENQDINPDDFTPEERTVPKELPKDDEDDDIDPEDKARIDKRISKQLSPLQERIQQQNDEIEVNSFIQDKPEFAKYKPVMLKYVAHPAYKNVPIKNIAAIVASNDLQKIGAQKEREAQKKVADTKGGGTQQRKPVGQGRDWKSVPLSQMEAEIAKAKGQSI